MRAARRAHGFTLLETVVALTLLAAMLAMLFGGMRMGIRAWEAGSGRGDRADQVLLAWSFVVTVAAFLDLLGTDAEERTHVSSLFEWLPVGSLQVDMAFLVAELLRR